MQFKPDLAKDAYRLRNSSERDQLLYRDIVEMELTVAQRELRTCERYRTGYRRLALLGWLAFVGAIALQSTPAPADTLPQDSLACVDEPAWSEQMSLMGAGIPALASGCVFTNRDYDVTVESRTVFSGSSVWIDGKDMLVWVDGGVLRP